MIKKLLLSLAVLCSAQAFAAIQYTYEKLSTAGTCKITGIVDPAQASGAIYIPATVYIDGSNYQVTQIDPYVFNNLPEVTKITIGKYVTRIGLNYTTVVNGDPRNFIGCPKLKEFAVESGNTLYTTVNGILCNGKYAQCAIKVPQAIQVTSSTLTIPEGTTSFAINCFAGVSTVSKLVFTRLFDIDDNGGLNWMPYLAEIAITDTSYGTYSIYQGCLLNKTEFVCFPPRKMMGSFYLPANITRIAEYAFANAVYISEPTFFNSLTSIGKGAFANSNVKQVSIPTSVNALGTYCLYNCKSLTNIYFSGSIAEMPSHFAAGATSLVNVKYSGKTPVAEVGKSAFAGCSKLTTFPFSGATQYRDSCFASTGLTSVVYGAGLAGNDDPGENIFLNCPELTTIDASAVETTAQRVFYVDSRYAVNCPKLKEVIFPDNTNFNSFKMDNSMVVPFIDCYNIMNIELGSYSRYYRAPTFYYKGGGTVKPNVYLKVNSVLGKHAPVGDLCAAADDKTVVKPIFYYEAYAPIGTEWCVESGNATYYVPGASKANFQKAIDAGCYVEEFYRMSWENVNGSLEMYFKTVFPDMVKVQSIQIDDVIYSNPTDGFYNTGLPASAFNKCIVKYTVFGREYTTDYPSEFLRAGVEDIVVDNTVDMTPVYYDLTGRQVTVPTAGQLYIVRRGNNTAKEIFRM